MVDSLGLVGVEVRLELRGEVLSRFIEDMLPLFELVTGDILPLLEVLWGTGETLPLLVVCGIGEKLPLLVRVMGEELPISGEGETLPLFA